MSLPTVLSQVHPAWYVAAGDAPIDAALVARARSTALGERVLARWLATTAAPALLVPSMQREIGVAAVQWPHARLLAFVRDVGVLSLAPAIRAEVGRDAVRRLKQALGNSYLLALDRSVWDGKVATAHVAHAIAALRAALASDVEGHAALFHLIEHHGRSEIRAWAPAHDAALGEWITLLHPREFDLPTVLPAQQVQLLREHHLARTPA